MQPLHIRHCGDIDCQRNCVLDGLAYVFALIQEAEAVGEGDCARDMLG